MKVKIEKHFGNKGVDINTSGRAYLGEIRITLMGENRKEENCLHLGYYKNKKLKVTGVDEVM